MHRESQALKYVQVMFPPSLPPSSFPWGKFITRKPSTALLALPAMHMPSCLDRNTQLCYKMDPLRACHPKAPVQLHRPKLGRGGWCSDQT